MHTCFSEPITQRDRPRIRFLFPDSRDRLSHQMFAYGFLHRARAGPITWDTLAFGYRIPVITAPSGLMETFPCTL